MSKIWLNEQPLEIVPGETVFEHADRLGIRIPSSCGLVGSCHECIVQVTAGEEALSPRTEDEGFLRDGYRLACMCRIEKADVDVHAHTLRRGIPQISSEGRRIKFELDPCVSREGGRVLIDGREVAVSSGPILGVAADIGTTTVVLRLIDLETGEIRADHSFENPQMFGGGDVMGRITYDRNTDNNELQRVLIAYINHSIEDGCEELGVSPGDIYEFVAAGNATMRDIFFGLDVQSIGQKPFKSLTEQAMEAGERETTALSEKPEKLNLLMNRNGRVYGVPLIACHVGADTSACLAAIDLAGEEQTVLLMDIGTNTEIVVGNKTKQLCASCPAGPAFEGGSVACGMPGLEGAIESVSLNGGVTYRTIGGVSPLGICGSGLIDVMGELMRNDAINMVGRLNHAEGRFWIDREHDIYINDQDLSELAQAKAANIAGILILLQEFGLTLDQIDRFYMAGGFAGYIDIEQARRIGMIPDIPVEKIQKIGNASIEGATVLLCSRARREAMESFVKGVGHVELEKHPNFFGIFVEGCQFKASSEMGTH